ncbi:type VI immunity family protein [Burkholderia ubonensis]|uniref:type VI immunity family protein n=1 Tax=Burkholderia ubonensis TaxID=101571 RepID=UPI000BA77683|nr:type VI immunity family protein [Burkholderia ubonensis]PAJ83939.1 hypothetical protein CJO70_31785 [Burkholderia ubonensis]PAK04385.1 hypothetical protein CJO67_30660 [Burkholderia ubonensis]RQP33146.1 DUF3396 domain-containing protein [Burkholderia ubonensis]RQP36686.1 DUF3396 domain-containing protein [Burkholderia ubonensis]RQP37009.1 DUF3396 domain-containing protein [Burkholderia ubonensis]
MTKDELVAWAHDPRRQDTLPFGLYEPPYQKAIVGAALVVRGVVYFKDGHTKPVREALVKCYESYMASVDEYAKAYAKAAGTEPPSASLMRWFYEEGESPVAFDKARKFPSLAREQPSSGVVVSETTSADHKLAAGFFAFGVFCFEDWQADYALDTVEFSVPRRFLQLCPGVFERLFAEFVAALPTIWGHAGFGVNLPPTEQEPNEASENFWSRLYGPGIDVGNPMRHGTITTRDRIKTVDWLTALDADFVGRVGGADNLMLPPDWFRKTPFGTGGLIIQAGPEPAAGVSMGKGIPPAPPAAYVLVNHALRPIVAEKSDILQSGTINSTAPLLNTTVATEAWLRRFNVPDDELAGYWVELHKTPKLPASS